MTDRNQTISILGAGYVGLTSAALLANSGYKVYAIEPDQNRLKVIQSGKSFFYEEGLDKLIQSGIDAGTLIPTDSYTQAVKESSVVFSCVGTPDNEDGSSNLSYVFQAAESVAEAALPGTIFVQKSTVPVGTGQQIIDLFQESKVVIPYLSNPEFLKEGTAIFDSLFFDRVVIGGDQHSIEKVESIYKQLESQRSEIARKINISEGSKVGTYIRTTLSSAELIKVTSNAFLALKISFANSIAILADAVNADIKEVMDAVGADNRIGRAFLNAGRGYGGGCFPKDVSGLISSGMNYGIDLTIMKAAQNLNSFMPDYIVEKIMKNYEGTLQGKKVSILGLAFKSNTSDARKSPGVKLANLLVQKGAIVSAYDPKASQEAAHELNSSIVIEDSIDKAISNAEIVIIATEWKEFFTFEDSTLLENVKLLVDAVNMLNPSKIKARGIQYVGVGRN